MKLWELLSPTSQRVDELMNQPAAFEWKRKSERSWEARFAIGDASYWVYLDGRDDDNVSLVFTDGQGSEEITGGGNAFQVFATVGAILRDFLRYRKPESIHFSAKEASRSKLYAKLASTAAKELGWKMDSQATSTGMNFYIEPRNTVNEDGKIIPNVNTTCDVQPGETNRQAAKFGNKLDAKGRPPLLSGSYGDDTARFSAIQGDPFYGSDGTRLKK